ncbi:hypothetical protein CR513_10616, partial [Mucuna pruriens]
MGDLLGSPRVAPLFSCDHTSTNAPDPIRSRFSRCSRGGIHIVVDRATLDRCDHTSTNAPDPIRTPQLSVLGRE